MATTTNYSWSTPDDTALVKDGAAAIRSLGTAIDSTVFTNAGAAINKTIVDAKGDLIVASGADAVARLAVGGTDGHVLTVNSGATNGVEWAAASAGSMTLISTTTLTGASVSLTSIPQTYKNLYILVRKFLPSDSGAPLRFTFNSDTNTRYFRTVSNDVASQTFNVGSFTANDNSNNSVSDGVIQLYLIDYADATTFQAFNGLGLTTDRDYNDRIYVYDMRGMYNQTTAITSIQMFVSTGTMTSGTALLYGVN
jgi:hypothetical protein